MRAAQALFNSGGYAATTIDAVAAKSGVAKTTIYRRWPNRASLLVDMLFELAATVAPMPEGREPMRALRAEMLAAGVAMHGALGRLITTLVSEGQDDPDVRAAIVNGLFLPRTQASSGAIRRAQEAGDVRPDVPPEVAIDMLFGPLFYRLLVGHAPLTDAFVKQVFTYVREGIDAQ